MGEEIFILKMKNILITPQAFTYLSLKDLKNMFGEEYNLFLTGGQIADSSLLKSKLQNIDACLIGSETINESILKYTPKLKFLSRFGVGYDSINLKDTNKYGVKVSIVKNINNVAVARHCLSLLLCITNNILNKEKLWDKSLNFSPENTTIGLLGMGPIAKEFAKMCEFLGFNVVYFSRTKKEVNYTYFNSIEKLINNSNIISLHLKHTDETTGIINLDYLKLMKEKYFLNTARGKLVDEFALYNLLKNNHILGAGLDVFMNEPSIGISQKLRNLTNVISTPHVSAYDIHSINQVATQSINNIKYFFSNNHHKIDKLVTYE